MHRLGEGRMRKSSVWLVLALLLGALLDPGAVSDAKAGPAMAGSVAGALQRQTLVQPVRVWRDCQRISRCYGCQPVYRCRSCTYQRQCPRRGPCQWADVCVWGPYLPLAPRGVPVY
jgi:hypothetical protein